MLDLTQQIKELEIKAKRYEDLKEVINNKLPIIFQNLAEVQEILKDLNPLVDHTSSKEGVPRLKKGYLEQLAENIFVKLREDELTRVSINDIRRINTLENHQATKVMDHLRVLKGISIVREGKMIFAIYTEPHEEPIQIEKTSFMR